MRRGFDEKLFWAKKAAELDVETEKGQKEYYVMAKESSLGDRRLSYYANAYEAAGESGVRALSYRKKMPLGIHKKAVDKINKYLFNSIPPKLRKEIGFLVKAKDNRITVSDKRLLFSNPSMTSCVEAFQVRYTDFDDRWHLYWMRKFHKWWPYIPQKPIHTTDDCIREVKNDPWGCFFL